MFHRYCLFVSVFCIIAKIDDIQMILIKMNVAPAWLNEKVASDATTRSIP